MPDITIHPPIGGIVRRTGYQSQPPFTCYDAVNVWPMDPRTGRGVISTRPSIVPLDKTPLDLSGFMDPVNLLAPINGAVVGKPLQSMVTAAGGKLYWWNSNDAWTAATGSQADQIDTGRRVFAVPLQQKVYIMQADAKPAVFTYSDGTVETLAESAGTIPTDARMATVWQGALWIAGRITAPHILYGSRVGDATDWDFAVAVTDTGGAFFTGGDDEGKLRGAITALFAHTSDTMVVSTLEGLVLMRGHPRRTGIFEDVGGDNYILGQGAWCKTPGGQAYFLTRLGLMRLDPTPGAIPVPVSADRIPDELVGLPYNYEKPTVNMAYDARWQIIHIYIRGIAAQSWIYDLKSGGFWRQKLQSYPLAVMEFPPFVTETTNGVLLGGSGYRGIGQMDRDAESEPMEASVTLGPLRISPNSLKSSVVDRAQVVLGSATPKLLDGFSADTTMEFATGKDGEEVVDRLKDDAFQYSTSPYQLQFNNGACHPKVAGSALAVKVSTTAAVWQLEEIVLNVRPAGTNNRVRWTKLEGTRYTCIGYASATPQLSPSTDLEDANELISLGTHPDGGEFDTSGWSGMPSDWWDNVNSTGGNIRVTDQNNDHIPFDLIGFSKTDEQGLIIIRRRVLSDTPEPVRIWVCGAALAVLPQGHLFGQFNAYPPWYITFWPSGLGPNRTNLPLELEPVGGYSPSQEAAENPFHPDHTPATAKGSACGSTLEQPFMLVASYKMDPTVGSEMCVLGVGMEAAAGCEHEDKGAAALTAQYTEEDETGTAADNSLHSYGGRTYHGSGTAAFTLTREKEGLGQSDAVTVVMLLVGPPGTDNVYFFVDNQMPLVPQDADDLGEMNTIYRGEFPEFTGNSTTLSNVTVINAGVYRENFDLLMAEYFKSTSAQDAHWGGWIWSTDTKGPSVLE